MNLCLYEISCIEFLEIKHLLPVPGISAKLWGVICLLAFINNWASLIVKRSKLSRI